MAYKLTYFNLAARAEPIRFLLSYGDLDFEDVRVAKKDFPKIINSKQSSNLDLRMTTLTFLLMKQRQ